MLAELKNLLVELLAKEPVLAISAITAVVVALVVGVAIGGQGVVATLLQVVTILAGGLSIRSKVSPA